ncbi:putative copia-type protein [Trifolium pratense]|uniref:Putative copia-type protein n=1 Tax=Trifolium pratense TaxID=57577 RepID=A0A2K3NXQ1_TRIPR|nr:putative copia-type protein [Trifolium pratense]
MLEGMETTKLVYFKGYNCEVEWYAIEREKLSFIRGNKQPPTKDDDGYEKWYGDNKKVKRWLLMAMTPDEPIRLYCDNKAACDIAHNPIQHDRTKHVEVDKFFIKEKLYENMLELPRIRSEDQLANILTKAVSSRVFSNVVSKLGMWDIYAPT